MTCALELDRSQSFAEIPLSSLALESAPPAIRKYEPEIAAARARGQEVIPCHIGGTSDEVHPVIQEARRHLTERVSFPYGSTPGIPELSEALSGFYGRRYGVETDEDNFLPTFGASEALLWALGTIAADGGEVLSLSPGYPNYDIFARLVGARVVPVPTKFEEGFALPPLSELQARLSAKTRAIIICDPDNPTGRVLEEEELGNLLEFAYQNGLAGILDRVYWNLVYNDGKEVVNPFVLRGGRYKDIIVECNSASKAYDLCGLRQGWLFSLDKNFMAKAAIFAAARGSTNTDAQFILARALQDIPTEYLATVRERYRGRRDFVLENLERLGDDAVGLVELPKNPCQGAFYAVFRLKNKLGRYIVAEDFISYLLSEEFMKELEENFGDNTTLNLAPLFSRFGGDFYFPGDQCDKFETFSKRQSEVRMAYVMPEEKLEKAFETLKFALESFGDRTIYRTSTSSTD